MLKLGSITPAAIHLGSQPLSRIMLGTQELWSAVDPDAAAYIAAVTDAGVSVSAAQSAALSAFVAGEKSAGRWDLHARLYLPIWANPAANALCLRSLTSGAFFGAVEHGAGHIASDGSTGYFNYLTSPGAAGLMLESAASHVLIYGEIDLTAEKMYAASRHFTDQWIGCSVVSGGKVNARINTGTNTEVFVGDFRGILTASRQDEATVMFAFRNGAMRSATNLAKLRGTAVNTASNMLMMAYGLAGGVSSLYVSGPAVKFGAHGIGLGMSDLDDAGFSLALQTLWESCTGLSLP